MSVLNSIGVALVAMACALSCADPAAAQTAIRFSLDSKFDVSSAPILLAIDKGYFQAEGLDVTVEPGDSSSDAVKRVGSGSYDMGLANLSTVIGFRDAHPANPVKAVFIVTNRPAFAIISRKSRGVEKPKDLEGKVLGAPATDPAFAQWRLFAKVNEIDPAKVKIESIGMPVREPMLQNGQVDAVTGLSYMSYVNLKTMGVPANDLVLMLMADYGVNLYGSSVVVSAKFAAEKPDAVKGFVRALVRGLKDTVKDPAAAADAIRRRDDTARKPVELERLQMLIRDNIVTPEVKANGYGAVDPDRLAKSIEQMAAAQEFKAKPKPADVFDASFLLPPADRKAD